MIHWQPGYVYPPVWYPPHYNLGPLHALFFAALAVAVGLLTYRRPALGVGALILCAPFAEARYLFGTSITVSKAALIGFVIALIVHRTSLRVLSEKPVRALLFALAVILTAIVLSSLRAQHEDAVAREFLKWVEYAAVFAAVVVGFAYDPDDRPVWRALIAIGLFEVAASVYQLCFGAASGVTIGEHILPRVAGTLEGPNQFAGWLNLLLPVLFARILTDRNPWLITATALCAVTEAATLSRSGIVAAVVAFAVVLIVTRPSRRVGFGFAAGAVAIAGILVIVGLSMGLEARFFSLAEVPQPDHLGTRAILWSAALDLWRSSPLVGIGAGNFEFDLGMVGHPEIRTHANSLYLQALSEMGLVGLAATLVPDLDRDRDVCPLVFAPAARDRRVRRQRSAGAAPSLRLPVVLSEDRRVLGDPAGHRRGRGARRPRRCRARAGGRVIRSRNPRIDVDELERRIEAELARDPDAARRRRTARAAGGDGARACDRSAVEFRRAALDPARALARRPARAARLVLRTAEEGRADDHVARVSRSVRGQQRVDPLAARDARARADAARAHRHARSALGSRARDHARAAHRAAPVGRVLTCAWRSSRRGTGAKLIGGAERLAWEIAHALVRAGAEVEVLATCCRSFLDDWASNYHRSGISREDGGVVLRRFPVDTRDRVAFNRANTVLTTMPRIGLRGDRVVLDPPQTRAFVNENINSRALLAHLREFGTSYDAVIFVPYLYGPTLAGVPLVAERAFLIPCVHDEAYAYLEPVRACVRRRARRALQQRRRRRDRDGDLWAGSAREEPRHRARGRAGAAAARARSRSGRSRRTARATCSTSAARTHRKTSSF